MIEVKNLQKAFGGHMVLKGVTETIEKGEKIALIGPSGSGKQHLSAVPEQAGGAHGRRDMVRGQGHHRKGL